MHGEVLITLGTVFPGNGTNFMDPNPTVRTHHRGESLVQTENWSKRKLDGGEKKKKWRSIPQKLKVHVTEVRGNPLRDNGRTRARSTLLDSVGCKNDNGWPGS